MRTDFIGFRNVFSGNTGIWGILAWASNASEIGIFAVEQSQPVPTSRHQAILSESEIPSYIWGGVSMGQKTGIFGLALNPVGSFFSAAADPDSVISPYGAHGGTLDVSGRHLF